MKDFHRVGIIGLGLMGGSMALGLKRRGFKGEIVGYDLSTESLKEAKIMGAIDEEAISIKDAVYKSDLVVVAVPLGYYNEIFRDMSPFLSENTIVTDIGSVKGYVSKIAIKYLPKNTQFIGGHPMSGSEKGGIKAANPFLYENAFYFLTPSVDIKKSNVEKLDMFVKQLGSYSVIISPEEHDEIVSQISHLPHLVASALVGMLDKKRGISHLPFVGGGFRDTTRIASGNPSMWKDIFFFNKDQLLKSVDNLMENLKEFRSSICNDDKDEILDRLKNAKILRDSLPQGSRDYMSPMYEINISVEDRPGVLGQLTNVLGENGINIKEIEILHSRQEERGAVRLAFASVEEQEAAISILKSHPSFQMVYKKEENK